MNTLLAAGVWYALAGAGTSNYYSIPNEVNNARFCDDGFHCSADNVGTNIQLGAGYRFDKQRLGLTWSVEGAYQRTGKMKLNSVFPYDHAYDVASARCIGDCSQQFQFRGDWHYNGAAISFIGSYPAGNFGIYGKLGATMYHVDGSAAVTTPDGISYDCAQPGDEYCRVQGWRAGVVYGLGVSYDKYRWKPFIEINQNMTSGQGYPGFANWTQTNIGVRVDLE
jgi:hypothetical protein